MTAPAHEWPTRTTGASAFRIARLVAATSSSRESSGFWTATTLRPAFSRYRMTLCQDDPSANAPWTKTTVLAFSSVAQAGKPITPIVLRRKPKPTTLLYIFMTNLIGLVGSRSLTLLDETDPCFVGPMTGNLVRTRQARRLK